MQPLYLDIYHYNNAFKKLRISLSKGPAPHKPILLLTVLQGVGHGLIRSPRIYVTPELLTQFKANWACLVKSDHDCKPSYPFFHLKSSGFWKLKAKPGYETFVNQSSRSLSLSDLRLMIEYAEIDAELFDLMCDPIANATLTKTLLDKFFPHHVENEMLFVEGLRLLKEYEENLLVADPIAYQIETKKLIEEDNEEEIFVRGGAFKREIPKVYQYTCAISGMRVQAAREVSLIDACHIVPFSESYDDTIGNGICLCPNLHRAFDRHLITITPDYVVRVSSFFTESEVEYAIRPFNKKRILLPASKELYPRRENLERHNEIFEKYQ